MTYFHRYGMLLEDLERAMNLAHRAGLGLVRVEDETSSTGFRLEPSTVWTSLAELQAAALGLRTVDLTLASTGAYASGGSLALERSFETLLDELDARLAEWLRPVRRELGCAHAYLSDGDTCARCDEVVDDPYQRRLDRALEDAVNGAAYDV